MNALIAFVAAVSISHLALLSQPALAQDAAPSSTSSTVGTPAPAAAPDDKWDVNAPYDTDVVFGRADAPVTVVEYGSLTCPHCAAFQTKKFPELKEEWVDTGKVRFIFRHFPIDQAAMGAAALVSCLPASDQHAGIEALYKDVNAWATKPLQESVPDVVGKALGRTLTYKADFEACVQQPGYAQKVLLPAYEGSKHGISGTPYFYVNGEGVVGFNEAQPRQIDDLIVKKLGQAKITR